MLQNIEYQIYKKVMNGFLMVFCRLKAIHSDFFFPFGYLYLPETTVIFAGHFGYLFLVFIIRETGDYLNSKNINETIFYFFIPGHYIGPFVKSR